MKGIVGENSFKTISEPENQLKALHQSNLDDQITKQLDSLESIRGYIGRVDHVIKLISVQGNFNDSADFQYIQKLALVKLVQGLGRLEKEEFTFDEVRAINDSVIKEIFKSGLNLQHFENSEDDVEEVLDHNLKYNPQFIVHVDSRYAITKDLKELLSVYRLFASEDPQNSDDQFWDNAVKVIETSYSEAMKPKQERNKSLPMSKLQLFEDKLLDHYYVQLFQNLDGDSKKAYFVIVDEMNKKSGLPIFTKDSLKNFMRESNLFKEENLDSILDKLMEQNQGSYQDLIPEIHGLENHYSSGQEIERIQKLKEKGRISS
jgi:hypothetical protein